MASRSSYRVVYSPFNLGVLLCFVILITLCINPLTVYTFICFNAFVSSTCLYGRSVFITKEDGNMPNFYDYEEELCYIWINQDDRDYYRVFTMTGTIFDYEYVGIIPL